MKIKMLQFTILVGNIYCNIAIRYNVVLNTLWNIILDYNIVNVYV